ncbi:MAG: hypothetical protein ACR2JF_17895 [Iamia sp.]
MAFGQQAGPPATHRQMKDLLQLVMDAGHIDLRDARGPLGLTQRQAGGKFTRDEADALIGLLEGAADAGPPAAEEDAPRISRAERKAAEQALGLRDVPDEVLAGELQRRGWAVMAP